MSKVTPEAAPEKNPNEETVELDTPIVRGEQSITSLTLRKPMAGELRGVKLNDLTFEKMKSGRLLRMSSRISR